MIQLVLALAVFCCAIWVYVDARDLGAKRGALGGGFLDSSALGWFWGTLLVWIIVFPCYLIVRPKLVAAKDRRRAYEVQDAAYRTRYASPFAHPPRRAFDEPNDHGQWLTNPVPQHVTVQAPPVPVTYMPAPGWYPDPNGRPLLAEWNGLAWTGRMMHMSG